MKIVFVLLVISNITLVESTATTSSSPTNTHPFLQTTCGVNAQYINGTCTRLPETYGNTSYKPECNSDQECTQDRACQKNKCQNPCHRKCGLNIMCTVINHIPVCTCPHGYTGNPLIVCTVIKKLFMLKFVHPCKPSLCGPNSVCTPNEDTATCSCIEGFQGSPPNCTPECETSSECPLNRVCIKSLQQTDIKFIKSGFKKTLNMLLNNKFTNNSTKKKISEIPGICIDPCKYNKCGISAVCEVVNHNPICSCKPGLTGDPYISCYDIGTIPESVSCNSTSCGPNPQCITSSDCSSNQLCNTKKCVDLCPDLCGENTECISYNHRVACSCKKDFTGNPLMKCILHTKDYAKSNWILWTAGIALPMITAFVIIIPYFIINRFRKNKIKKQTIDVNVNIANRGPLPLPPISQRGSLSISSSHIYRARAYSADSNQFKNTSSSTDTIYEEIDNFEFNSVVSPEELQNIIKNLRENKNKTEEEPTYCPMHPRFMSF